MRRKMNVKGKNIAILVGLFMALLLALSVLGNFSSGFTNFNVSEWTLYEVNEENLWQQAIMMGDEDGMILAGADGITIEATEENVIKIDGTAEKAISCEIAVLNLAKDTDYVIDMGLKNGSNGTIFVKIVDTEGNVLATAYNGAVVIEAESLTEAKQATVIVEIAEKVEINNLTLKPVVVAGASANDLVDFYA